MKRGFFLIVLLLLTGAAVRSQNVVKIAKRAFENGNDTVACHEAMRQGRFDEAVRLYASEIKRQQGQRDNDNGVDGEVMAEYAYALAASHNFEYALVNIDRARAMKAKYADFYTNQVLTLMGNKKLADEFSLADMPEWLMPVCDTVRVKRTVEYVPADSSIVRRTELDNVRKLMGSRQYVQALVLLRRLEESYPQEYILSVLESVIWDELGERQTSATCLKNAIGMMDNTVERSEYSKQLEELKKSNPPLMKSVRKIITENRIRTMVYAGGTIALGNYALDTRVGVYTYNQYSASLNLSFNFMPESFTGSLGIFGYKTWKFIMGGLGVSCMFSKGGGSVYMVPTVGVTFPNSSHTASFDVTFNCYVPLMKDAAFNWGLSFGRTFYF